MMDVNDWIGREIAGGRYKILERIGVGSMGQVYRALDRHLETDVVIKCPIPAGTEGLGTAFLSRFDLEIRSLVHLSHPHIIKIIDVGADEGHPYVVMQYLSGRSLKDRMEGGPGGERRPLPPASLWDWLMDVAKALDFVHGQNYLHRDVKPDNILFDRYGNAFLSDFGIIKMLATEGRDRQSSSMTAPGYLIGTPNYVAPEVVMGGSIDPRTDQYSLAMTVYEVLAGSNPMEGPTPSATIVNQTKIVPPPLREVLPDIPGRLSDAVQKGLSKRPDERFDSCVTLAHEILAEIPSTPSTGLIARSFVGMVSRGAPGHVTCPVCQNHLPVGRDLAGKGVQCTRCQATLRVESTTPGTVVLNVVGQPSSSWTRGATRSEPTAPAPPGPSPAPKARTGRGTTPPPGVPTASGQWPHESFEAEAPRQPAARKWPTYAMVALVLVTCALFLRRELVSSLPGDPPRRAGQHGPGGAKPGPTADDDGDGNAAAPATPPPVVINIAYGTEKRKWLEAALREYLKTTAGREVRINLLGMGSVEGAMAVLDGPKPAAPPHQAIHVWSPASSTYRDLLESEWRIKHGDSPILSAANLALTPMVFVMWRQRHDAFLKRYAKVNFHTVAEAMKEPGGWQGIASKPEWGLFKFGHTDPNRSNSGLQMLILMAYESAGKQRGLTVEDVTRGEFQGWLRGFELGVTRHGSGLTGSTGDLMEEMVLRGPSQYDCLMLYENLAIDYMRAATERWGEEGEISVAYPDPNIWNEHPYYILNVPWSDDAQREAAAEFLKFLMSEPIQRRALEHGFRPGNHAVPVSSPESPLVKNRRYGLQINLPTMCAPPTAEVVQTVLGSFRRIAP